MNFAEFRKAIDAALRGPLSEAGFSRIGPGTWNRRSGEMLNAIQLQKHRPDPTFCVNLGIHYTFLPKAWIDAPLDKRFLLGDCDLRLRLTDHASSTDQWWPIALSSIDHVTELVCRRALPIFASYRLDGEIASLDGKAIESGNPGLLAPKTQVRACLLLARMHEYLGNRDKAIEAAEIGLRLSGPMAVIANKWLKDVLTRCEQMT